MLPVSPRRAAIVAGSLVGMFVLALFSVREVPDRALAMLGGPRGGVERHGGGRVRFRPPQGVDARVIERDLARSTVTREGDVLVIELPGIAREQLAVAEDLFVRGGLHMSEAIEDDYAVEIARDDATILQSLREQKQRMANGEDTVLLDVDFWRAEHDGATHTTYFLASPVRRLVSAAIERARARGWRPAPNTEILFAKVEPEGGRQPYWRTYEVSIDYVLDGRSIANAIGATDPNTNRPTVLLDFDDDGAEVFCDTTRRLRGHKVAMILGSEVASAPVINDQICNGRVSIAMGGTDPAHQLRERDALVAVLQTGALPRGGTIDESRWYPAPDSSTLELLARRLLAAIAGLVFGIATALVVRFARPQRDPGSRGTGAWPWWRILVTMLAPVAAFLASWIDLPGVDAVFPELGYFGRPVEHHADMLGLMPVVVAFIVVELVSLVVPPLRRLRGQPLGRVRLGQAVAALAIVLAVLEAWSITTNFQSLDVLDGGIGPRVPVMATLVGTTLLFVVVAGMIREHGLGNGYVMMIVMTWLLRVHDRVTTYEETLAQHAFGLLVFALIAIATAFVVRWRTGERAYRLSVPVSGFLPIANASVIAFVQAWLLTVGVVGLAIPLHSTLGMISARTWVLASIVLVPIWALLFAIAGRQATDWTAWRRGVLASLLLVVPVAAAAALASSARADAALVLEPLTAMLAGALVVDVIADARAHRAALEPAWVLHEIQHAGRIERVLGDAGIPCHLHARHVRALLALFGPFAPVVVMVPAEHATEARLLLGAAQHPP